MTNNACATCRNAYNALNGRRCRLLKRYVYTQGLEACRKESDLSHND